MKATIKRRLTKSVPSTLLNASLAIVVLAAISGCGQKGPLVLEQVPIDQVQAPLENAIERIPVETPAEADAGNRADDASTSE